MCLVFSFFPATIFVVIGYFVLFASTRADGFVHTFGLVLAVWLFIIALFFPLCGAFMTFSGLCPMKEMMQKMKMPSKE
jgi:hypothetical protein